MWDYDFYSDDGNLSDEGPLPTDYDPEPDLYFNAVQHALEYFRNVYVMDSLRYIDITTIIAIIRGYFEDKLGESFPHNIELSESDLAHYSNFIHTVLDNPELEITPLHIYDIHYLLDRQAIMENFKFNSILNIKRLKRVYDGPT